jgi:hypothetical protein
LFDDEASVSKVEDESDAEGDDKNKKRKSEKEAAVGEEEGDGDAEEMEEAPADPGEEEEEEAEAEEQPPRLQVRPRGHDRVRNGALSMVACCGVLQLSFMPSASPADAAKRYLVWNAVGSIVTQGMGDEQWTVEIEFADSSRRIVRFTDRYG